MTSGLSEAEAAARRAARAEPPEPAASRSTAAIVRANTLTPFNAILLALGVLTLTFGDWRDALFLGIIVANTGIGIWQELRAKQKLDALAALVAPQATVVRDGEPRQLHVSEVVEGDLVRLAAGDQVVADGFLLTSSGLRFDESILTGESAAVERAEGEEVRSGSFVVEGSGSFEVAAVGAESYAERIAGTAREFRHPRSPLERSIDRLLYVLLAVMVPLGIMLIVALRKQDVGDRRRCRHRRRGDGDARPRGADPAGLGDLCRGRAAHGPRGRAVAAAERDRVARLGRHDLRRQDRDADDGLAPPRRGAPGAGHDRGGARRRARPLRGLLRGAEPDADGDRRGAARDR